MWFGNEDTVEKIVDRIIEARPAAVLIAGDFVYKPTDDDDPDEVEYEDSKDFMPEVKRAAELLRPLTEAKIPVYAVLGNHDYGMNYKDSVKNEKLAEAVRQNLRAEGIAVLENQAVPLKLNQDNQDDSPTLYLAGIDSLYAGKDRAEEAISRIPENAPHLIMMHNPDSIESFPPHRSAFAVAGHTHGGQIRLPFTENWSWMTLVSDGKVHADGWIKNFGNTGDQLYVNRGIGFSSFPLRINCRPEITVFTLERK